MIKMYELRELIKLVDQSAIDELELENSGVHITIKKAAQEVETFLPVQAPASILQTAYSEAAMAQESTVEAIAVAVPPEDPKVEKTQTHEIVSSWVGAFISNVKAGEHVEVGQIVCSCNVDALKLVHEIKSTVSGEVIELLAEDGQLIEYGQPLILLKAD